MEINKLLSLRDKTLQKINNRKLNRDLTLQYDRDLFTLLFRIHYRLDRQENTKYLTHVGDNWYVPNVDSLEKDNFNLEAESFKFYEFTRLTNLYTFNSYAYNSKLNIVSIYIWFDAEDIAEGGSAEFVKDFGYVLRRNFKDENSACLEASRQLSSAKVIEVSDKNVLTLIKKQSREIRSYLLYDESLIETIALWSRAVNATFHAINSELARFGIRERLSYLDGESAIFA